MNLIGGDFMDIDRAKQLVFRLENWVNYTKKEMDYLELSLKEIKKELKKEIKKEEKEEAKEATEKKTN